MVSIMPRAAVCGSSSAPATELILPHGTPTALSLPSQASALSRASASPTIPSTAARFSTRARLAAKRGSLGPFRMAEHLGGAGELGVVADRQRHHGVGGAIGGVGHDARMAVAEPAAALAGDQHVRRDIDQHGERRRIERDVDLLALAGAMARVERRQDRVARQHAGADIDDRHAVFGRAAILLAADAHQAGLGLQDEVVARLRGLGAARCRSR